MKTKNKKKCHKTERGKKKHDYKQNILRHNILKTIRERTRERGSTRNRKGKERNRTQNDRITSDKQVNNVRMNKLTRESHWLKASFTIINGCHFPIIFIVG